MSLLKRLCYACLLCIAAASLASCGAPPEQQQTPSADTPAVYYNDYLGISISVPPGWQINALSSNLAAEEGQTGTPLLLEYGGGSSRMELIDMQNSVYSNDANHSRFYAYAELFAEPVEAAQYVELLASLLEADNNGYTYTLYKQEQLELSRHTAERICLQVSNNSAVDTAAPDAEQTYTEQTYTEQTYTEETHIDEYYIEEYYIVTLGQAFVVFYINYWPQNEDSRTAAFSALESVTLPAL